MQVLFFFSAKTKPWKQFPSGIDFCRAKAGFQSKPCVRIQHVRSPPPDNGKWSGWRSRVFDIPQIKTAQDEVCQDIKTCHTKIPKSYGELDCGWPQGWVPLRFWELLSKIECIRSPISNSVQLKPAATAGFSSREKHTFRLRRRKYDFDVRFLETK